VFVEISVFLDEFDFFHLNMTRLLHFVLSSDTSGLLIPKHVWDQWTKRKIFVTWHFQSLLEIKSYWFLVCG